MGIYKLKENRFSVNGLEITLMGVTVGHTTGAKLMIINEF